MYAIKVKTQFEGWHRYKNAPEQVKFLREFHRHLFEVEALIKTTHADRQVEFFIIKEKIDEFLLPITGYDNKFDKSCEEVAEDLFHHLKKLGLEVLQVEVREDQESSGIYYG